jgi:hypothetical protein
MFSQRVLGVSSSDLSTEGLFLSRTLSAAAATADSAKTTKQTITIITKIPVTAVDTGYGIT